MPTAAEKINALHTIFEGVRDERRTYANTATRIGNAFLALLSYLEDAPFLRKDIEDVDMEVLRLLKGAIIGESNQIRLNPDGSISCGSIRVNGSAIFDELVFNHQNVLEGDTYFTDKGIIESVEHTDLGQYVLTFRQEYAGERTTFHVNDILLGKVNNLDASRSYRSFWLRVDSISEDGNSVVCSQYGNTDVPGGVNYPPEAAARVIRWGNTVDESRQSVWFVSSNEGRWLFLQGVNKPILDDTVNGSNYAGFIGLPPDIAATHDLITRGLITQDQPYLYFRGIMVQDLIKVDYNGNPEYTSRDKGQWNSNATYICGYDNVKKGYFSDRVWWGGCYWQCAVATCTGSEPRFNNTDWTCLIGGANMSVDIVSSKGDFFEANTDWTTDLVATVWNAEMQLTEAEVQQGHITWTRISNDADGDAAWNNRHQTDTIGLTLAIDSTRDLPSEWKAGSTVGYRCVIEFVDGQTAAAEYTIVD